MTKSNNIYFDKLEELLILQKQILKILKTNEIIENHYFEKRNRLISEIIVLKPEIPSKDSIEIKEKIVDIENKINKEANLLKNLSKLKIEQHNMSTLKMVNYFKSQIELQSEIDINI